MDLHQLVDQAQCTGGLGASRPPRPDPFVEPSLVDGDASDPRVVMVTAPAAVGKSTFARWLADTTHAHFVDLSVLNVGSHGFLGNLAAHSLQEVFDRGELTVVIDALDEGLVRSGFGNYEAFFQDLAARVNAVSEHWPPEATRVVLLGRPDAGELTRLILAEAGIPLADIHLDHMTQLQATELVLAHTPQHTEVAARRAAQAFFSAAARALHLDDDALWSSPLGRGFVGYAPVLRAVAELIAANPAAVSAQWERPTEWGSAWQLLADTAHHLLLREQAKLTNALEPHAAPLTAYGPEHQLELLAARLRGERVDPCGSLNFDSSTSESAFREAVELHLPEHPFLAEGASEVFGSLVAAVEIARGGQMTGAERDLGSFSTWPFMWRFFADYVRRHGDAVVDGSSIGWVLASLWNGVEDPARVTAREAEGHMAFEVLEAGGATLDGKILGELALRGIARNIEVEAPATPVQLGQRHREDASVFVMRDACSIRCSELVVQAAEVLIESDSVVVLDVARCDSPIQRVNCRPRAEVRVNRALFRHPWAAVAQIITVGEIGDTLPASLVDYLGRASRALPHRGLPAYLDGGGRPMKDDHNFQSWSRSEGEALGELIMQLVSAGVVSRSIESAHGPVPTYSYRPSGFVWEDLPQASPSTPPWSDIDWTRVNRYV